MQPTSILLDASSEPEAVRSQLARILASPDFKVPPRLAAFLTFVVEETLAGRGDKLKAFTIGVEVFGRGDDFDSMNDPVVRIEAGRLRRGLERYYLLSGSDAPLVIDIPKGSYTPTFARRRGSDLPSEPSVSPPPADKQKVALDKSGQRWKSAVVIGLISASVLLVATLQGLLGRHETERNAPPNPEVTLVVVPFSNLAGPPGAHFSAGIFEELLGQLARFRELRVVGNESKLSQRLPGSSNPPEHYRLEGSVRAGQHVRVVARLLDAASSRIIWSEIYDRDLAQASSVEIESDIAAKVALAVAQPYGAIFTPTSLDASAGTPSNADAYRCVLRYYQYRKELSPAAHAPTRECLEHTTRRYPNYATGWAMLAHLYLDEDRYGLNKRISGRAGKERAHEAAEEAVRLDPANARGLQALMTVLFFSQKPEEALRAGERALALNPNDTEVLAEYGSRIAQFGSWQRGTAMLEDALARTPAQTGYYVGLVALGYYMQGDDKRALEWIRRADFKRFSIYHFVAALIFARSGLQREARASAATFLKMQPRFFDNFSNELAMRNFNARDRAILTDGARQAGFPISLASN